MATIVAVPELLGLPLPSLLTSIAVATPDVVYEEGVMLPFPPPFVSAVTEKSTLVPSVTLFPLISFTVVVITDEPCPFASMLVGFADTTTVCGRPGFIVIFTLLDTEPLVAVIVASPTVDVVKFAVATPDALVRAEPVILPKVVAK